MSGHYFVFVLTFYIKKKFYRPTYCWRFHIKRPQKEHNDRTTSRDRQMERDFTTCPSFGLHPALHSFILSTLMLFSLTAWLPFLSVCLALSLLFLAFTCTPLLFTSFFFLFLSLSFWHHSHTSLCPPPLWCYFCCLCSSLWKWEKKTMLRSEGVCQKYTNSNPLKLHCY